MYSKAGAGDQRRPTKIWRRFPHGEFFSCPLFRVSILIFVFFCFVWYDALHQRAELTTVSNIHQEGDYSLCW